MIEVSDERATELLEEHPEWVQRHINAYLAATIKDRQMMSLNWKRLTANELEATLAKITDGFEAGEITQ